MVTRKYELRPYQARIVNQAMAQAQQNNKPFLIASACGSGKSLIIAEIAQQLGGRTLVLQPSRELLEQNTEKMLSYTDDVSVYSASVDKKEIGDITMATLGSIKNVKEFETFDNLIIDEADYGYDVSTVNSMFMKFVERCNFKTIIGLTATPYRMRTRFDPVNYTSSQQIVMLNRFPTKGNSRYGTFFWGNIVGKVETQELIDGGYLTPVQYFTEKPECAHLLKVNTKGSEYTDKSMEKFGDAIVDRAMEGVRACVRNDLHKRVLVYLPSVESAEMACEWCLREGIKAGIVTADTKKKERKQLVEDFKAGNVQVMFNVRTLTTGFDCPELDAIIMASPTLSPRLYYQEVGRVMRLAEGKTVAKVYDVAGNVLTFGPVEKIKLAKEGFKDALIGSNGRLDNITLSVYKITPKDKPDAIDRRLKI